MSDRTSACIFGEIFRYLAECEPTERTMEFAMWLYKQTGGYDFSTYQMGADDALAKLGLPLGE